MKLSWMKRLPCDQLKPHQWRRWHVLEHELHQIVACTHQTPSILELGVRDGKVPQHLMKRIHGLTYWGIDAWTDYQSELARGDHDWAYARDKMDRNREQAESVVRGWPRQTRLIEGLTQDVHAQITGKFDIVWIDADHSYDAVARDIDLYRDKVKPGGIVCGHDYDWPEVHRAVHERYNNVESHADDVWLVRTKQ